MDILEIYERFCNHDTPDRGMQRTRKLAGILSSKTLVHRCCWALHDGDLLAEKMPNISWQQVRLLR
jgi:hypothetical protein